MIAKAKAFMRKNLWLIISLKVVKYLIVLYFVFYPSDSKATVDPPTMAIAMHGSPKYAHDFTHLEYANINAPKGGELHQAVNGHFDTLNNHIIMGSPAKGLALTNDRLMARVWDEPFSLYGLVAENIDVATDRSWIIFHLNPKAKFHDGQPITTDDVIFSYEAYKKHGHPVRRRVYSLVDKVSTPFKGSVQFDFGEGYDAETALILAIMPVLPKHYWTAEGRDISKTTLTPPLGSGPYKIEDIDAGHSITYSRVPDYWAKDLAVNKGHYNFDKLKYSYYRDDSIAFEAFKAGEYNLRRETDIRKWKTGYNIKPVTSGKIKLSTLNHDRPDAVKSLVFNTREDIFADKNIRQAMSLMFDFDWINKNMFYSSYKRIDSFFPNSELANPQPKESQQSTREKTRKALKLFETAGWAIKNKQMTNKATGLVFNFEILLQTAEEKKIALSFARSLERIGINAKVRQVESAQYQGRLDDFDYDMVFFTWINSLSPGNEQMNYWGSLAADTNGSRNYAGVKDKLIDKLANDIAKSNSREELVERTHKLDSALLSGHYAIPLYYLGKDLIAHSSDIKAPDNTPIYGSVIETWWKE